MSATRVPHLLPWLVAAQTLGSPGQIQLLVRDSPEFPVGRGALLVECLSLLLHPYVLPVQASLTVSRYSTARCGLL